MRFFKPEDVAGKPFLVPFTEYTRPRGRKSDIYIPVQDQETKELALTVIEKGGRFECKDLNTGAASFTCAYQDDDIAIELVFKRGDADFKITTLIQAAFDHLSCIESVT